MCCQGAIKTMEFASGLFRCITNINWRTGTPYFNIPDEALRLQHGVPVLRDKNASRFAIAYSDKIQ